MGLFCFGWRSFSDLSFLPSVIFVVFERILALVLKIVSMICFLMVIRCDFIKYAFLAALVSFMKRSLCSVLCRRAQSCAPLEHCLQVLIVNPGNVTGTGSQELAARHRKN